MRSYLFIAAVLFSLAVYAGTNTLVTRSDGQIVRSDDVNQYKTALGTNVVPRNTSGVPTDEGGSLGDTSYQWSNIYGTIFTVGDPTNLLTIEDNAGDFTFKINGVEKLAIASGGIPGSDIQTGTVTATQLGTGSVGADEISAGAVGNSELANDAVKFNNIDDHDVKTIAMWRYGTALTSNPYSGPGAVASASSWDMSNSANNVVFVGIARYDSGASTSSWTVSTSTGSCALRILRDGSTMWEKTITSAGSPYTYEHELGVYFLAQSSTTTYTFQLYTTCGASSTTFTNAAFIVR